MTTDETIVYIEVGIRRILEAVDKERAYWAWSFSNGQIYMAENIGIIHHETARDLHKKVDECLDTALVKLKEGV
jgi:hypothetical protein